MTFPSPDATREEVKAFLKAQPRQPKKAPAPSPGLPQPRPDGAWPPCVDCGEEDSGTCSEGRCRDCDIDFITSRGACRSCFVWIVREDWGGPRAGQHKPDCPLKDDPDYWARDAEEERAVRIARVGWAPEAKPAEQPAAEASP